MGEGKQKCLSAAIQSLPLTSARIRPHFQRSGQGKERRKGKRADLNRTHKGRKKKGKKKKKRGKRPMGGEKKKRDLFISTTPNQLILSIYVSTGERKSGGKIKKTERTSCKKQRKMVGKIEFFINYLCSPYPPGREKKGTQKDVSAKRGKGENNDEGQSIIHYLYTFSLNSPYR